MRRLPRARLAALLVAGLTATLVTIPAGPALGAAPFGNALKLDGADDHARVDDNASLDLGDADGEDFTLEAFVYVPDETSDAVQVIYYKQNAYRLSVNFNVETDDVLILGVWPSTLGADQLLTSTSLTTGWHHIAGVYDNEYTSSNDRLSLFLDGSMVGDTTAVDYTPGIYNSTNVLSVGANFGAAAWDGWIDEARLSDEARYSGTFTVPTSPFSSDGSTRALWHFDEACSTSFADSSPNANTLTGYNGAQTGTYGAVDATVELSASDYPVNESAGSRTVTVKRSGNSDQAFDVEYQTSDGTATAGSDYTSTSGLLTFTACEMQKTFSVPVADDGTAEDAETIDVSLTGVTAGAVLGEPNTGTITIAPSDQRPDGWISKKATSSYIGDDIYNTTAANQTKRASVRRGDAENFYVRAYNDGTATNTFKVTGTGSPSGAKIKYFVGTTNITSKMRSAEGYAVTLAPGAFKKIRVKIAIANGATVGSSRSAKVTAAWSGDVVLRDTVKAVAKVAR